MNWIYHWIKVITSGVIQPTGCGAQRKARKVKTGAKLW